MVDFIRFFDIDYGIDFVYPLNWIFISPPDFPVRYAVSPDEDVVIAASVLEPRILEGGLDSIVKFFLESVTECEVKEVHVLLDAIEEGKREFRARLDSTCGEIFIFGVIEAANIKGLFCDFSEHFAKCVMGSSEEKVKAFEDLLVEIKKSSDLPGLAFDAPFVRYEHKSFDSLSTEDVLWTISVPCTAILVPQDFSVSITVGGLMGQINFLQYNSEFLDENYVDSLFRRYARNYLGDNFKIQNFKKGEYGIYAEASSETGGAVAFLRWGVPVEDGLSVVIEQVYSFPITGRYGAMKIVEKIMYEVKFTNQLLLRLFPPKSADTMFFHKKISKSSLISSEVVKPFTKQEKTSRAEECKRKLPFLKNQIDTLKMRLRLLEQDYETRLSVLESVKSSDVITSMYTFETPSKKIRHVHSKTHSPMVGDSFWERKDSAALPFSKGVSATRKWYVPRNRHEFVKLRWKVEEEIKKLKQEYQSKKSELERELKKLEHEYQECISETS